MWCKSCRQDVPGIASPVEGHYCCARCSEVLLREQVGESVSKQKVDRPVEDLHPPIVDQVEVTASDRLTELRFSSLPSIDDWELDEQLKHVERMLAAFRPPASRQQTASSLDVGMSTSRRTDEAIERPAEKVATPEKKEPPQSFASFLVWLMVTAGWVALACGGALTGWGWYIHRDDFWNLGLPILFGGQLGLLVGLMLQLLLTLRAAGQKEKIEEPEPVHEPVRPAIHAAGSEVDQRLARMQRQIDGFTQRFDPSGR